MTELPGQLTFDEIAYSRTSDPLTSYQAAASVKVRESQQTVLCLLSIGPATDEQLADRARLAGVAMSPSGLRTRRSELVALERVRDTGRRERTRAGRQTIVWAIA